MPIRLRIYAFVVFGSMILTGCDEGLSSLAGPTPDLQPSFASIQSRIFESSDSSGRSACIKCHSTIGRNPSGGLSLDHSVAYNNLVNAAVREKPGATRVIPGDPTNSYIIHKLEGSSDVTGRRMPFDGPPYLTGGQIQIIQRWISIGAPQN
jgi:hypothetical protein